MVRECDVFFLWNLQVPLFRIYQTSGRTNLGKPHEAIRAAASNPHCLVDSNSQDGQSHYDITNQQEVGIASLPHIGV